ncbi:MAG: methionyl-tRNA formyltransferase [Oceanospirillaceae bacterium]|nr:methionyl-tRNA formyltransferase [Oceanospirillaceae bacterium]
MKIVLIGQKWLAATLLVKLQDSVEIKRVITPNNHNSLFSAASAMRLPIKVVPSVVKASDIPANIDLIVCAHSHSYLSNAARRATKHGAIGYHPSLLPNYRGKDAIETVITNKDKVTGGSVYWLDDTLDAGAIELQDWCHIQINDTAHSLWQRELAPMGLRLLTRAVNNIKEGNINPCKQNPAIANE